MRHSTSTPSTRAFREVAPGDRPVFRQRQDRRGHRTRRVNDGPQVGVVVIEDVRADAVHQGRVQHVQLFLAPEHRRLAGPRKRRQRRNRDIHGFVPRAADRAARPIQQRALRFLANRSREVLVFRGDHIARQLARDVFRCRLRFFRLYLRAMPRTVTPAAAAPTKVLRFMGSMYHGQAYAICSFPSGSGGPHRARADHRPLARHSNRRHRQRAPPDAAIVMSGGRIAAMGPAAKVKTPAARR